MAIIGGRVKTKANRLSADWILLAPLLILSTLAAEAGDLTVTPLNQVTDMEVSGVRTIFFRSKGAGGCVNQRTYPANGASIDPLDTTTGLIFTVQTSSALKDINNGADVTDNDDLSVRVELDGTPTTAISLVSSGAGYSVSGQEDSLSFGTSTSRTFAISTTDISAVLGGVGFCDQAGVDCQPDQGEAATPKSVRFVVTQTGTNSSSSSTEDISETIQIVMADCPAGAAVGTFDVPTLSFGLVNGDQRVKIANNTIAPTSTLNVPLTKVVVYAQPNGSANGVTIGAPIAREFSSVGGGVYTIDGLANDTQYCFSLGYVNAAGLVTTDSTWSSSLQSGQCATPARVDGFLDRSTCFIASAAYGDEWDPRLETLRQFRDQVLARTGVGRAFISWYYDWSPRAAHWLMERPKLRVVVRAALLPVVEGARGVLWVANNAWWCGGAFFIICFGALLVVSRRDRERVHAG